jgi:hypothetical protein
LVIVHCHRSLVSSATFQLRMAVIASFQDWSNAASPSDDGMRLH